MFRWCSGWRRRTEGEGQWRVDLLIEWQLPQLFPSLSLFLLLLLTPLETTHIDNGPTFSIFKIVKFLFKKFVIKTCPPKVTTKVMFSVLKTYQDLQVNFMFYSLISVLFTFKLVIILFSTFQCFLIFLFVCHISLSLSLSLSLVVVVMFFLSSSSSCFMMNFTVFWLELFINFSFF